MVQQNVSYKKTFLGEKFDGRENLVKHHVKNRGLSRKYPFSKNVANLTIFTNFHSQVKRIL